jgi:hypothetical protein
MRRRYYIKKDRTGTSAFNLARGQRDQEEEEDGGGDEAICRGGGERGGGGGR